MLVTPPHRRAASGRGRAQTEDDLLAFLLIHTWTLTTGRVLRSDVPPAELSAAELIAFWADERTAAPDTTTAAYTAAAYTAAAGTAAPDTAGRTGRR